MKLGKKIYSGDCPQSVGQKEKVLCKRKKSKERQDIRIRNSRNLHWVQPNSIMIHLMILLYQKCRKFSVELFRMDKNDISVRCI